MHLVALVVRVRQLRHGLDINVSLPNLEHSKTGVSVAVGLVWLSASLRTLLIRSAGRSGTVQILLMV